MHCTHGSPKESITEAGKVKTCKTADSILVLAMCRPLPVVRRQRITLCLRSGANRFRITFSASTVSGTSWFATFTPPGRSRGMTSLFPLTNKIQLLSSMCFGCPTWRDVFQSACSFQNPFTPAMAIMAFFTGFLAAQVAARQIAR